MAKIIVDITVSLDGYVTGPNAGPDNGLGDDAVTLHDWAVASEDPADAEILRLAVAQTGAVVMGRNTFDVVDGPHGWSEHGGYGAGAAGAERPPVFVVTHVAPDAVRLPGVTICTDGLDAALDQARTAAADKDVFVMGGGELCRDVLQSGRADELRLHTSPMLLGDGTPLFRAGDDPIPLERRDVVVSDHAIHARYDVVRAG